MSNPFTLLNMEPSYTINLKTLEKHYFEAQKKNHPDQFSGTEKADALRQSALINQAYTTLKNPLSRAACLLKEVGIEPLRTDPAFLGEVMMWNERAETGEDIQPELMDKEHFLWGELETAFKAEDYEQARTTVYQLKYLEKLLRP
jgi:molecular chaperone HscB